MQPDGHQLVVMWGSKGGAGTTVAAAATAITHPDPVLLVDLAGDTAAVLGVTVHQHGLRAWLASDTEPEGLDDYIEPVAERTTLLQAGLHDPDQGRHRPQRVAQLANWLRTQQRTVIVDAGSRPPPIELADAATTKILVTRNDYVALANAIRSPTKPDQIILIHEPHRPLDASDVEAVLAAPVITTIVPSPSIARAVDAGLFAAASSTRLAGAALTRPHPPPLAPPATTPSPTDQPDINQPDIDYGSHWRSRHSGGQHRIHYNPDNHILYSVNTDTQHSEQLGSFNSRDDVDTVLAGWAEHHDTPDGLDWIQSQLGIARIDDRVDVDALMTPDPAPTTTADTRQHTMQHGIDAS